MMCLLLSLCMKMGGGDEEKEMEARLGENWNRPGYSGQGGSYLSLHGRSMGSCAKEDAVSIIPSRHCKCAHVHQIVLVSSSSRLSSKYVLDSMLTPIHPTSSHRPPPGIFQTGMICIVHKPPRHPSPPPNPIFDLL